MTEDVEPKEPVKEPEPKQDPDPIPYSRFKEVNDKYKIVSDQLKELQDKQKAFDDERAKKQGEFERLYNESQAQIKKMQNDNLRLKVGRDLPAEIAELLKGDTEEEMNAHAETLRALIAQPEPKTKGVPPKSKDAKPVTISTTPADIRASKKDGYKIVQN